MDNCYYTTKQFLRLSKVKYTKKYLKDSILSHPEYDSLLAVSDSLKKYHIENTAIKIDKNRFDELPYPCIIQVHKNGNDFFYTLRSKKGPEINYYDDLGKLKKQNKSKLIQEWTGVCLLAETNVNSKEPDIQKKLVTNSFIKVLLIASIVLLASWVTLSFLDGLNLFSGSYVFLKFIGVVIGVLLLWFSIDQFNPALQSFCTGGKNVNCNAVLKSKYANLFNNELFSLSIVSFAYFLASLLFLVVKTFDQSAFNLLSYLSFIALPVILISIYYQAAVIKQWCKFCILIDVVLVLEIFISYIGNFYKQRVIYKDVMLYFGVFILILLCWNYLKPLLEKDKEILLLKRNLNKIKNNPVIFKTLLSQSNKISNSSEGLGIYFTNENAKYDIVKVCNPYCGPCAKAHPILENLLETGEINLRIIFTATTNEADHRIKPVRHLMAIDSIGNIEKTRIALGSWYNEKTRDYEIFAKKFPLNGELQNQDEKIIAMDEWCKAEKITHTPTIFINGHELPAEYRVDDLIEII